MADNNKLFWCIGAFIIGYVAVKSRYESGELFFGQSSIAWFLIPVTAVVLIWFGDQWFKKVGSQVQSGREVAKVPIDVCYDKFFIGTNVDELPPRCFYGHKNFPDGTTVFSSASFEMSGRAWHAYLGQTPSGLIKGPLILDARLSSQTNVSEFFQGISDITNNPNLSWTEAVKLYLRNTKVAVNQTSEIQVLLDGIDPSIGSIVAYNEMMKQKQGGQA